MSLNKNKMQYKEVKCLGRWSSYLVQFFFPDYLSKPYQIPVLYIDQNLNGGKNVVSSGSGYCVLKYFFFCSVGME